MIASGSRMAASVGLNYACLCLQTQSLRKNFGKNRRNAVDPFRFIGVHRSNQRVGTRKSFRDRDDSLFVKCGFDEATCRLNVAGLGGRIVGIALNRNFPLALFF